MVEGDDAALAALVHLELAEGSGYGFHYLIYIGLL